VGECENEIVTATPQSAQDACRILEQGNLHFAGLLETDQLDDRIISVRELTVGLGRSDLPAHHPFAAVIGCADARVPVELIFSQTVNDLFVVRVAGNVLGQEVIGSIDYAITQIPTVKMVLVLAHTGCGALRAAVDAYLDPTAFVGLSAEHQIRSIVSQLYPSIRLAHSSLMQTRGADIEHHPRFAHALVEVSVVINAAVMSAMMRSELSVYDTRVEAMFGVYDLTDHLVGLPLRAGQTTPFTGLVHPPRDAAALTALSYDIAEGDAIAAVLDPV